jgi:hypothetical protein
MIVLCLLLMSCERAVVQGTVVDIEGRPLPGVSVRAAGGEGEAITNALGRYSLTTHSGIGGLEFIKNGYTLGRLDLAVSEPRTFKANTVSLWCLPQSAGVYLFENSQYRRTTPIEPERFALQNSIVYGIGKLPELEAAGSPVPLLICHKMPPYDVRMSRLHEIEAMSAQAGKGKQTAWVQEASIPVELLPIDEPERLLMQVRTPEALTPGVYALHWGALDGHTTTDTRVFAFKVSEPLHQEEAETAPSVVESGQPPETKSEKTPVPPDGSAIDTRAVDAEAGETAAIEKP